MRSAAPGAIEVYSEYLESNKFPGENQSLVLRDYLRRKYADRTIDVVVPTAHAPLDFLFKHRDVLFRDSPIVFATMKRPTPDQIAVRVAVPLGFCIYKVTKEHWIWR